MTPEMGLPIVKKMTSSPPSTEGRRAKRGKGGDSYGAMHELARA